MYKNTLKKLVDKNLINSSGKISPWIDRKISDGLREEVLNSTSFLTDICLSDRIRVMMLDISEQPLCLTCNSPTTFHRTLGNFSRYCSKSCFNSSEEKSDNLKTLAKDGKLAIGINAKKYQQEKYNGLTAIQADKSIREKIKNTCLERYGVDNGSKTQEAKDKISKKSRGKNKHFIGNKPQHSNLTQEQIDLISDLDSLYNSYIESKIPITIFSENLGFSKTTIVNLFNRSGYDVPIFHGKGFSISHPEKEICSFLDSYDIKYEQQYKIEGKKFDVYIPEYNFAIEYNGLMFHSFGRSEYSMFNNHDKQDSNIHLNKLKMCENNNIELFQIFENEWINLKKKEICLSIIKNKLKLNQTIYGRKCEIKEVGQKESKEFLNTNHIQGYCNSSVKFGLFCEDELVSIMTFGKPRFNKNYQWELIRFCNKLGVNVIGGCDKLFKHFIKTHSPLNILSYCDKRLFTGKVYSNLGFEELGESKPNYFYFTKKEYILHSRNKFQKHKLETLLDNFDPVLTERENMFNNGYRIIWDCGNKVFVWKSC